jgi:hypothetical protein
MASSQVSHMPPVELNSAAKIPQVGTTIAALALLLFRPIARGNGLVLVDGGTHTTFVELAVRSPALHRRTTMGDC